MSARRNGMAVVVVLSLVAAAFALRPAPAVAGAGHWTSGGPDGGSPAAMAVAPSRPRVIYAGGGAGWVFGSVNGGAAWRALGRTGLPEVTTLTVDPMSPLVVFAASNVAGAASAIAKSSDGGRTWRSVGSAGAVWGSIVVNPVNPSVVYATDGRHVDVSTDGGETWSVGSFAFFNVVTALVITADGSALLAATQGEIRRSADGGQTWTLVGALPSDTFGRVFGTSPSDPAVVYAGTDTEILESTDGGLTWAERDRGLPPGTSVYALAVDPMDAGSAYAGNRFAGVDPGAAVYATTDHGAHWRAAGAGIPAGWTLALVLDPDASRIVTVSVSGHGLYTSTDGGASWSPTGTGLVVTTVNTIVAGVGSVSSVFAGTDHGLYRSGDTGRHWALVDGGLPAEGVADLAAPDRGGSALFAATNRGVYLSRDDGDSWTPTAMAAATEHLALGGVGSALTLYASADGGEDGRVYKSSDQGRSWIAVYDGPGVVAARPDDPGVAFVGDLDRGIVRTIDGGTTWAPVAFVPALALVVDPVDPSVVYAGLVCGSGSECSQEAGPYGVWKSADGGATWHAADAGLPEFVTVPSVAVDRSDHQVLYAGTAGFGVYRSTDGGATWAAFGDDLATSSVTAMAVAPSGRVVHAGTVETGAFEYGIG